jgi:signal transduction histidine kinase
VKIRTRLTLQFLVIVGVIFGTLLVGVYSLSVINIHSDFYRQLEVRDLAAANIYLEKDEVSKERYEVFQQKFLQTLPEEIIQVFDSVDGYAFIDANSAVSYPKSLLARIRVERLVSVDEGERQATGIYYEDNQGNFVIIASAIDAIGKSELERLRLVLLLSFLASMVVVYFAGRFFAGRTLSPLRGMVKDVNAITASNLHRRLNESNGKDELAELAITFNVMLKRIEKAFETQQSFVSNASHELRTPLTAMIGEIDVLLSRERGNDEYKSALHDLSAAAAQLKELLNMLLGLAETDIAESRKFVEEVRIDELLWDLKERAKVDGNASPVVIETENLPSEPEDLVVRGNRRLLGSAFSNVIDNALKFSGNREVRCSLTSAGGKVEIAIADSGVGMTDADVRNLFQPFFRGENARAFPGHGIGLALAEKIIRLHGGSIHATTALNKGTCMTIVLPIDHF